MTRDEVLERARVLAREGHTLLPADDPERGMKGFVAYQLVDGEEQSELLSWPMFNGPLEPEKAEVTPEELVEFSAAGSVGLCDDPYRLLVGFVKYEPERGAAVIRQVRMVKLKEAAESTRNAIRDLRARLQKEWDQHRSALSPSQLLA